MGGSPLADAPRATPRPPVPSPRVRAAASASRTRAVDSQNGSPRCAQRRAASAHASGSESWRRVTVAAAWARCAALSAASSVPCPAFAASAGGVDAFSKSRCGGVEVERFASGPGVESELDLGDGAVHDEPRLPQRGGGARAAPARRDLPPRPTRRARDVHSAAAAIEEPSMEGIDRSRLGLCEQSVGAVAVASARREHGAGDREAQLTQRKRLGAFAVIEDRVGLGPAAESDERLLPRARRGSRRNCGRAPSVARSAPASSISLTASWYAPASRRATPR